MAVYSGTLSASNQDAAQATIGAGCTTNATDLQSLAGSYAYWGFRFSGVTITKGATIADARIQLYVASTKYDDLDCTINGQLTISPASFGTGTDNIHSRTKTTASVTWTASSTGSGYITSPNLAAILQELVNQASWTSASRSVVLIFTMSDADNNVLVTSYDNASGTNAALLSITYDAALPTGISSGAALGSPTVSPGPASIAPTAIGSGSALGTPAVSAQSAQTLAPTGIASSASVGLPAAAPGAVSLTTTAISSGSSVGTPSLASSYVLSVGSVGISTSLGTPIIESGYTLSVSGLAISTSLGTPGLAFAQALTVASVVSGAAALGSAAVAIVFPERRYVTLPNERSSPELAEAHALALAEHHTKEVIER